MTAEWVKGDEVRSIWWYRRVANACNVWNLVLLLIIFNVLQQDRHSIHFVFWVWKWHSIMFTPDLPTTDGGREDRGVHLASRLRLLSGCPLPFGRYRSVSAILHRTRQQEQRQQEPERWAAVHWATVYRAPWRTWQTWFKRCLPATFIDTSSLWRSCCDDTRRIYTSKFKHLKEAVCDDSLIRSPVCTCDGVTVCRSEECCHRD